MKLTAGFMLNCVWISEVQYAAALAQVVERQIVVLDVMGSSPICRPKIRPSLLGIYLHLSQPHEFWAPCDSIVNLGISTLSRSSQGLRAIREQGQKVRNASARFTPKSSKAPDGNKDPLKSGTGPALNVSRRRGLPITVSINRIIVSAAITA